MFLIISLCKSFRCNPTSLKLFVYLFKHLKNSRINQILFKQMKIKIKLNSFQGNKVVLFYFDKHEEYVSSSWEKYQDVRSDELFKHLIENEKMCL